MHVINIGPADMDTYVFAHICELISMVYVHGAACGMVARWLTAALAAAARAASSL